MWKKKDMIPEDESSMSAGVQYATGEEKRAITNSSRKNKVARPKWKWHSVVDLTGGESKVQFCKEDYYIGPWNVRPMNQGILDMVKQGDGKIKHQYLKVKWTSRTKWTLATSLN